MAQGRTTALVLAIVATAALLAAPAAAKKKPEQITQSSGSAPTAVGNGAIATATAVCPPNRRATGGGFLQSVPQVGVVTSQGSVYESQKVGQNAWRASSQLFSNNATNVLSLTAYAYCRKGAPKTTTAVTTAAQQDGPSLNAPVTASCAGKKKALAGGFSTPPPFSQPGHSTIVLDSFRSAAKTWSGRVLALGQANPLSVYAYCAKSKKAPPQVSTASPLISTTASTGSPMASCKGSTRALHGGFSQPQATLNVPASQIGFFIPYESRRIVTPWQVSGLYVGSPPNPPPGTIVSTAYCG